MRIVITAGSSGGHIFPALSLLNQLSENNIDTLLVLPFKSKKTIKLPHGCRVSYVSTSALRLKLDFNNLLAIVNLIKGFFQSSFILAEYKPDIVVGFGGIESFPTVFLGWFFRIKTLLHEQNVVPGRANRVLAKLVDHVAISFAETKKYLKVGSDKIVLTGNPIRKDLKSIDKFEARRFFGLDKDKFTILVMGGSQGSRHINSAFLKAIVDFKSKLNLQVIHLIGMSEPSQIESSYNNLGIRAKVISFLEQMEFAYSASDVAVTRSGATTVTELIFFKLPAILIPYPYAYQHQTKNALVLEEKGCAVIIKDEEIDGNALQSTLGSLINNNERLVTMRKRFSQFSDNFATGLLVKEVLALNNS